MPKGEEDQKSESVNSAESGNPNPAAAAKGSSSTSSDAVSLLKQDHRKVEGLFDQALKAGDQQKRQLIKQICDEIVIHSLVEERLFYPACRQASTEDQLDEAQVEHDSVKVLVVELMDGRGDEFRDAKLKVLNELVRAHIQEEEAPDGVMAKAQKAGVNTAALGEQISQLKQQLQQAAQSDRLPTPRVVSLHRLSKLTEEPMPRDYQDRDRDEYGRFMDEDRGRSRGSRDDDDRRYGRGRGWYGDPEGHSEASERGWAERGRGESRTYYRSRDDDDDRRYASRDGGRDRGHGGWFGDPEGHSEASRRGWDERGRGESRSYRDDDDRRYSSRGGRGQGWYGDPEGHSEASRRGWDERERGGSRRYRDDDDDRRYSSRGGRGQGGWFGDSEGHAEAARRGWDDRR